MYRLEHTGMGQYRPVCIKIFIYVLFPYFIFNFRIKIRLELKNVVERVSNSRITEI